jgi:thiamine-monophosphate kinase
MSDYWYVAVTDAVLRDLGERRLVVEVLGPRYSGDNGPFGDDCATLVVPPDHRLVVTTDPCPKPMAEVLGFDDLYYRGWLLATINLSDLAAAGATPLGMLTSLVLPSSLRVADLIRLLDGVDACCASNGTAVVGGNLKEGPQIDVQGTAFGVVRGSALSRRGSKAGDIVALAGPTGSFWAGALIHMEAANLPSGALDRLLESVLTPRPQLTFGGALLDAELPVAVMDNSDGLGPSLTTLAEVNEVGVLIDLTDLSLSDDVMLAASTLEMDPARLVFGWGDWQLVVTVGASRFDELSELASQVGVILTRVGEVTSDQALRVRRGGHDLPLAAPDSQRFAADSWFTIGIAKYIDHLRTFPLP